MCGIGGAIGRREDTTLARFAGECRSINARRGPDHDAERELVSGEWRVWLAHNRLTILDLTPAGNQPMPGADERLWITFNGEIYNHDELRAELRAQGHRFHSTSDTEVLLAAYAAWGTACFQKLNGMFAFALLDRSERTFLLVRDRYGVKPLHYHLEGHRLLFASTPRPIAVRVGREPNLDYLGRGTAYALFEDDSAACQYQRVRAVRPAHFVRISLAGGPLGAEERPYYRLADRVAATEPELRDLGRADAIIACRSRLLSAVTLRLRADVPVAVSLSGGVDSATVSALAAEGRHGLVGFTFGHPERPESEGPMAARVAATTGMRIEFVWPRAEEMVRLFWDCMMAQDAPFSTGSVVAQFAVFRAVRAAGVKVLLGGQGGDEVFMGYRKYLAWRWLRALGRGAVSEIIRSGAGLASALWADRAQWRIYLGAARRHLGGGATGSLLRLLPNSPPPYNADPALGLAGRQIADMSTGGLPTLLRYEDRNSMENSVESRLPYLDYRLVEWAVAAPVATKLAGGYGKWMLRQVARDGLPRELTEARAKRGFDVRIGEWVAAGLGAGIRAELSGSWRHVEGFFAAGVRPTEAFSDRALAGSPRRFGDAVAALWIGRCLI